LIVLHKALIIVRLIHFIPISPSTKFAIVIPPSN